MLKLSDRRNFARTYTGLALILAPALILLATIVGSAMIGVDADEAAERFRQIADNQTAYVLGSVLYLLGSLLLLGASVGLIHLFRGRGVTFGQLAASLLLVGSAGRVGSYVFAATEYEMATRDGVDRAQLVRFVDQVQGTGIFTPLFVLFAAGIVLGLILLGIALWRRGIVPAWAGLLIVAAGILALFAEGGGALAIASVVLLLAGLGGTGATLVGMSDDQWEAGAPPAGDRLQGRVGTPGSVR